MTKWFNTKAPVDLTEEDLRDAVDNPVPVSILDRTMDSVDVTLERCRAEESRLQDELDGITERLKQTRIVIEAFESAAKVMDKGKPKHMPRAVNLEEAAKTKALQEGAMEKA